MLVPDLNQSKQNQKYKYRQKEKNIYTLNNSKEQSYIDGINLNI